MSTQRQGAFRLFRVAEIDVLLHWTWFLVAAFEINGRARAYASPLWNVLEYLALFLIVLLHEFGHALACKQVGGSVKEVMLWPLGGVAYVNPPQRPAAVLWSIAAGPLVNVILIPILLVLGLASRSMGLPQTYPDAHALLRSISYINVALLVFNLLPIYPLDGGQILRALLWFVVGRARSLTAAAAFGLLGVIGLVWLAIRIRSPWFVLLSVFVLMNCWRRFRQAQALTRIERLPRRDGFACPSCKTAPATGSFWKCSSCATPFDTFATGARCPRCGQAFAMTMCLDCRAQHPMHEWMNMNAIGSSTAGP